MEYQIGTKTCLNIDMAWLPKSVPPCDRVGRIYYFAADQYGNALSSYFDTEAEVHQVMGSIPSFTPESLQLQAKTEYLSNANATWASQDAYNTELLQTQAEITQFNTSNILSSSSQPQSLNPPANYIKMLVLLVVIVISVWIAIRD